MISVADRAFLPLINAGPCSQPQGADRKGILVKEQLASAKYTMFYYYGF